MWTIVGLGNPGEEYENTRHNAGREALLYVAKQNNFASWEENKKCRCFETHGTFGKEKVQFILPETFMNKSGQAVSHFVKSLPARRGQSGRAQAGKKATERLIVVHDDIDMPLGKIKIVFGRGSGGHRGVESINRAIKTRDYIRVRVGVSRATPTGTIKKPHGEEAVIDFLMGKMRKPEQDALKKVLKRVGEALAVIATEGRGVAMNRFN